MSLLVPFLLMGASAQGAVGGRSLICDVVLNPGSTAAAAKTLWIKSDNTIRVENLRDETTGAQETGATVEITMVDAMGVQVPGVTWPVAATQVAGSPGTYDTIIPSAAQLAPDRIYVPQITVTTADGVGHLYLEDPYAAHTYRGE